MPQKKLILILVIITVAFLIATAITQPKHQDASFWKVYTSSQLPYDFLKPYSIQYPNTWTPKVLRGTFGQNEKYDQLLLSKGKYEILIYQAPADLIPGCYFKDTVAEIPNKDLRSITYTQIQSEIGLLRRYATTINKQGMIEFAFCWSSDGTSYTAAYRYGMVTYYLPKNYDQSVLEEMDSILKTIKAVK